MGVKGLWRILEPVKQHMCLADLRGQIIAVDLSIWIVEAKSVLPPSVTKPHLRFVYILSRSCPASLEQTPASIATNV